MKGRKPFNQERAEKMIRNEFQRANNFISMFNHASLEGGEAYYGMLAKITQPCLIIHGTDDLICHYKNTALLLKELKNAELLNLEGTGHELHHEDWETIIDGIVRLTNK